MDTKFHRLSQRYLEKIDPKYRKRLGQYFTPPDICGILLSKLPKTRASLILDPACGSGEFLSAAARAFENPTLHGWEIDGRLAKISKKIAAGAEIEKTDALLREYGEKYDFVIGNPPYFEFIPSPAVKKKFADVINGRANIFSMFIKLGIEMLKDGGRLAYVVPPSMNNGRYFLKLRKFIAASSDIEHMEILESPLIFRGARQAVMFLILKKGKNTGRYIFDRDGVFIFSPESRMLEKRFKKCSSLKELGFCVKTGQIVWNLNRYLLTGGPKNAVMLIWSHNITDGGLKFGSKKGKPQYIKVKKFLTGPAIVVNRITGAAGKARIKAAIVPAGMRFVAENHVNVIFPSENGVLSLNALLSRIKSPDAAEIFRNITGNTQVSKTELENLFPVKTG